MKFVRGMLGYMISGLLAMGVWDSFIEPYGIIGGYIVAFAVIGPLYYMNHYVGLIDNREGDAFVDMALGIGVAGIVRDLFVNGFSSFADTVPTLFLVVTGAVLGGIAAAAVETHMEKESEKPNQTYPAEEAPGPGYLQEETVEFSQKNESN